MRGNRGSRATKGGQRMESASPLRRGGRSSSLGKQKKSQQNSGGGEGVVDLDELSRKISGGGAEGRNPASTRRGGKGNGREPSLYSDNTQPTSNTKMRMDFDRPRRLARPSNANTNNSNTNNNNGNSNTPRGRQLPRKSAGGGGAAGSAARSVGTEGGRGRSLTRRGGGGGGGTATRNGTPRASPSPAAGLNQHQRGRSESRQKQGIRARGRSATRGRSLDANKQRNRSLSASRAKNRQLNTRNLTNNSNNNNTTNNANAMTRKRSKSRDDKSRTDQSRQSASRSRAGRPSPTTNTNRTYATDNDMSYQSANYSMPVRRMRSDVPSITSSRDPTLAMTDSLHNGINGSIITPPIPPGTTPFFTMPAGPPPTNNTYGYDPSLATPNDLRNNTNHHPISSDASYISKSTFTNFGNMLSDATLYVGEQVHNVVQSSSKFFTESTNNDEGKFKTFILHPNLHILFLTYFT